LGNAEPVKGVLNVLRNLVPVLALLLGGLDVIEEVVEVDGAQVAAPGGHRLALEDRQRLQALLQHPRRFALARRDLFHDLAAEAALRLEDVVLAVVEAIRVNARADVLYW